MIKEAEINLILEKMKKDKENEKSMNRTKIFSYITSLITVVSTLVFIGVSWGFTKGEIHALQKEMVRMDNTIATSRDIDSLSTTIKIYGEKYDTRFEALDKRLDRIEKIMDNK